MRTGFRLLAIAGCTAIAAVAIGADKADEKLLPLDLSGSAIMRGFTPTTAPGSNIPSYEAKRSTGAISLHREWYHGSTEVREKVYQFPDKAGMDKFLHLEPMQYQNGFSARSQPEREVDENNGVGWSCAIVNNVVIELWAFQHPEQIRRAGGRKPGSLTNHAADVQLKAMRAELIKRAKKLK